MCGRRHEWWITKPGGKAPAEMVFRELIEAFKKCREALDELPWMGVTVEECRAWGVASRQHREDIFA